jgi:hypothetical protein
MKGDLTDFDGFGIEPELRRFRIAGVADEHIEQSLAVCLARDSIRFAGEVITATFAFINENTHAGDKRGKEYARRQSSNTARRENNSFAFCSSRETDTPTRRPDNETDQLFTGTWPPLQVRQKARSGRGGPVT